MRSSWTPTSRPFASSSILVSLEKARSDSSASRAVPRATFISTRCAARNSPATWLVFFVRRKDRPQLHAEDWGSFARLQHLATPPAPQRVLVRGRPPAPRPRRLGLTPAARFARADGAWHVGSRQGRGSRETHRIRGRWLEGFRRDRARSVASRAERTTVREHARCRDRDGIGEKHQPPTPHLPVRKPPSRPGGRAPQAVTAALWMPHEFWSQLWRLLMQSINAVCWLPQAPW